MNPLNKLSIRSKFIILMLVVSITSIVAIGIIGNRSGEKILKSGVSKELNALKNIKAQQIESYFRDLENNLKMLSSNKMIIDSMREFIVSYNLTKYNVLKDNETKTVYDFYEKEFLTKLESTSDAKVSIENIIPKTISANYLQYHYIINNKPLQQDDSSYKSTYTKFHTNLSQICTNLGFEDLYFVNAENGDIVYSVKKNIDFATNLYRGVHKKSSLAQLAQRLNKSVEKNVIKMVDYEKYIPDLNKPTSFVGVSVYDGNEFLGSLIIKLPSKNIENILTSNSNWESVGLGKTGELFLVGSDYKIRSNCRMMIESPDKFKEKLIKANIPKSKINEMYAFKDTTMNLNIQTDAMHDAIKGNSKTSIINNHFGERILCSYKPLKIKFVNWCIVTEQNLNEAQAAIKEFREKFAISTIVITFLVTLFAMVTARVFTKPVNALIEGVRNAHNGDTKSKIEIDTNDEFHELATSFNSMIDTTNKHKKSIIKKNDKILQLLNTMMPENIAKRHLIGEKNIVENHTNVTIIFTALTGFSEVYKKFPQDKAFTLLNDLIESFDESAVENGVEKIKNIGDDYLAACGLSIPRFDHARKAVNFSIDILSIIERFNEQNETHVSIKIGLDSGSVIEGLIGKVKFEYNVWGDAVDVAAYLRYKSDLNSFRITQSIYEAIEIKNKFKPCRDIQSDDFGEVINYQYKFCTINNRKDDTDV